MNEKNAILDPAFLRDTGYSYFENTDKKDLSSILCFALTRHNKDLILHQQRIENYADDGDRDLIFSAIVDLFISLEDKGTAYKRRIYGKYEDKLSELQSEILFHYTEIQLQDRQPIENLKASLFNKGLQGDILSKAHV